MNKLLIAVAVTSLLGACAGTMNSNTGQSSSASSMSAGGSKMVGGAAMLPSKDIVDNAVNSKDHTTLVAAVKAAGLVDTLKSAGFHRLKNLDGGVTRWAQNVDTTLPTY